MSATIRSNSAMAVSKLGGWVEDLRVIAVKRRQRRKSYRIIALNANFGDNRRLYFSLRYSSLLRV
jgi:hypothetical protein